jgi:hypothetical protein
MRPEKIKHVRKIIQSRFPKLDIAKTPAGFFYFYSKDKKINTALMQLFSTAVFVYVVSELTACQWLGEAAKIMERLNTDRL